MDNYCEWKESGDGYCHRVAALTAEIEQLKARIKAKDIATGVYETQVTTLTVEVEQLREAGDEMFRLFRAEYADEINAKMKWSYAAHPPNVLAEEV